MTKHKAKKSTIDGALLAVVAVLLVYGLLALYSATFYVGNSFWERQLLWIGIGLVAGGIAYRVPYPYWQKVAPILMAMNLIALLVTVLYAKPVLGASRGLVDLSEAARSVGGVFGLGSSVQPGVIARLVTVIYIAAWLASKGEQLNQVKYGLVPFGMIVGLVGGLVFLQPDLSTALLILVTGVAMFFFAGGDPIQIVLSGLVAGVPVSLLVWNMSHAR
ncbi:MAG: FtsW/RodA/SpoVE family cell cycle protein, partial [Anaerolineae bacterium]|nr:FtsW/RodA/SpoVE family cell cycle protein [Anaerolineae bacterium]